MKKYHIQNYVRWKHDMAAALKRLPDWPYQELSRDELITKFLPLVESLARKFSTAQQASGVMSINDLIQERIRGAIRRQVDMNRGSMRIPEHKLNEIRKDFGEDRKAVELFFNSVFTSLDDGTPEQQNQAYNIPEVKQYNKEILAAYIKSLMLQYLNPKEFQVLRLSYGLDCDKHSAKDIAMILGIKGSSSYVRISQLKKQAIDKLIEKVPHSQVIDYL